MNRFLTLYLAVIFCLIPQRALSASCHVLLFANMGYGHINGFSQTPKGGTSGTTTFYRPTFHEVNARQHFIPEWGGSFLWKDYFFTLGYLPLRASGHTLLQEELLTHSKYLPPNSPFEMHVRYDWFTMCLGKEFLLRTKWVLAPFLQGNWVKYHYHFRGLSQSRREFTLGTISLGFKIQYHFNSKMILEIGGQHSVSLNQLTLKQAFIHLDYPIKTASVLIIPRIGIAALSLNYRDNQPIPNHIRYTASPYGFFGVTLHCGTP